MKKYKIERWNGKLTKVFYVSAESANKANIYHTMGVIYDDPQLDREFIIPIHVGAWIDVSAVAITAEEAKKDFGLPIKLGYAFELGVKSQAEFDSRFGLN